MRISAPGAPGAPRSAAWNPSAKVWNPGFGCGNHRAIASAAHFGVSFAWHWLHAFGTPSDTVRSGRGIRKPWSCRGSTTM